MGIVGGLDVHREQVTYDYVDEETGEVSGGQIRPATAERMREWLGRLDGQQAAFALEATTGWRFVVEELVRAGVRAHLAEPADTRALRGPKRRAKTDRADARHLRELLQQGRLPESWIPPKHVQEARTLVRLRKSLVEDRTSWQQRIRAVLFHQGMPRQQALLTEEGRSLLASFDLPAAARATVETALRMIDGVNDELVPLERQLRTIARRQPGCRALQQQYGVGALTAVAFWAELGDARRFSSSRQAVRYAGLDVTVSESAGKRAAGKLSRQGSPVLRWAAYEAAKAAARPSSPDHRYYLEVRARQGHNRASLSVGRRIIRRSHHILRDLGDQAMAPVN